ncbi:hypothetical protein [Haloarcula sp. H-GB5]
MQLHIERELPPCPVFVKAIQFTGDRFRVDFVPNRENLDVLLRGLNFLDEVLYVPLIFLVRKLCIEVFTRVGLLLSWLVVVRFRSPLGFFGSAIFRRLLVRLRARVFVLVCVIGVSLGVTAVGLVPRVSRSSV